MDHLTTTVYAGVFLAEPRTNPLENPNLPLNAPGVWDEVFGDSFRSDSGISITAEKALTYAPFNRAVQLIAGDVAKLPRPVYKRRPDIGDDARERDRGHRLNYILNVAANEETEAVKFWCRFMEDALIWSNGWARIMPDGTGSPAELVNLLPDRTCWERIDGNLWCITEVGGRLIPLYPWEVLHIEGPRPTGIMKPLYQMARNSIALGLAQEKFASKFFANGGRVGGILELPSTMGKPARDKVEEGFRASYDGADNPFKTVILRDNAKFHAAQQSPNDSQLVEATEAQTRAIAHWFNLPPSKLGLSDSVSYNSKAEDNQNYLDTTLAIWLTRIESACNFRLISERQADSHFVEHNTSALLKMDLAKRAEAYTALIAARVMNPNEVRAKENMLPYDGGDEFVNPNTMKSGNEPGATPKQEAKPKPKRDATYLRVLFGITARARDKAKRGNAFLEWIDGKLAPNRAEWRHLWSETPFPFDDLQQQFHEVAGRSTEAELSAAVESICNQWEEA
jgi:HK97 family phage portal protein